MQPSESLRNYRSMLESEKFRNWDRFRTLRKFVSSDQRKPVSQVSILTIGSDGTNSSQSECEGHVELAEFFMKSPLEAGACRLFLVENLCPETVALLHEELGAEPDFFARHVNNETWFRVKDIVESLPELPSALERLNYLHVRWIEVLSVYDRSSPDVSLVGGVLDFTEDFSFSRYIDKNEVFGNIFQAWRGPDRCTTRIPRLAEKISPNPRPDDKTNGGYPFHFHPLLCARFVATVRFVKHDNGGWIGILILDPVFQTTIRGKDGECYFLRSLESHACNLPSLTNGYPSDLKSSRKIITDSWNGLSKDKLNALRSDCFMTLHALYSVVAHNWLVFSEYLSRELATIEYILEIREPAFLELEIYLKALYCHRRRCTKYYEIVAETRNQCATSGQKSWHSLSDPPQSKATHAMERDFVYLQTNMQMTERRIDKNIDLLAALVAIGEGKQSLEESKGITRLTLFATIFIPSSTVATILGMGDPFGPGSRNFKIFWAVAVPLTVAALIFVFVVAIKRVVVGLGKKHLPMPGRKSIRKSKV